jgi:hypothetical protein
MQALEDHFGAISKTQAKTGQLLFRHTAHVHFVQTDAVKDFHVGLPFRENSLCLPVSPEETGGVKALPGHLPALTVDGQFLIK